MNLFLRDGAWSPVYQEHEKVERLAGEVNDRRSAPRATGGRLYPNVPELNVHRREDSLSRRP